MIRMNRLALCLSIAGLALAACGSDPDPDAAAASAAAKPLAKPAPRPDDPTVRMAQAVGNGKPGAAVLIRYDFGSKPAIGTPTELQLAFIPQAGVDALEIMVSGMDGVTLSGPLTASFAEVVPSKPYLHTVLVLPDRAGVFYRSVLTTTQIGNSSRSRTFAIPFSVGHPQAKQNPAPQTDA